MFFKHNAINFNGAIEPHNIIILSRPEYYNNYHSFLTKVGFILTTKKSSEEQYMDITDLKQPLFS